MTRTANSRRAVSLILTTLVFAFVLSQPVVHGTALFKSPLLFNAGPDVKDLVVADFNSDGALDLVITDGITDTVLVLLGRGDGSFSSIDPIDTGDGPDRTVCADFNQDDQIDLAVTNKSDNSIWVYRGDGEGGFQHLVSLSSGNLPKALKTADFNNDGIPDLISIHQLDSEARLFFGHGDGTFDQQLIMPIGELGSGIECADFNSDGNIDLVLGRNVGRRLAFFPGNGDGTFADPLITMATDTPELITAGDFNEDDVLDLAVGHLYVDQVHTYFGYGDGSFSSGEIYGSLEQMNQLKAADLDGDGHLDLAVSHWGEPQSGLKIFVGAGDGSFQHGTRVYVGPSPGRLDTGDFNADGQLDTAVLAPGNNAVAILLGRNNALPWSANQIGVPGNMVDAISLDDFDGNGFDDLAVAVSDSLRTLLLDANGYRWGEEVYLDEWINDIDSGDINGDGIPDLVSVQGFIDTLSVHLGAGDGSLLPFGEYPTRPFPSSISLGDLNGDGSLDVMIGHIDRNSISVFVNEGDGSFNFLGIVAEAPYPTDFLLTDLNQDGHLDLVIASHDESNGGGGPGGVRVLRGHGNGTFAEADLYVSGGDIIRITVGDLNMDGAADLAASNLYTENIIILLNDGQGQFVETSELTCIDKPGDLQINDFDLDGHDDLAVGLYQRSTAMVFSGDGDGSFGEARLYPVADGCGTVVSGDFDGNGIPDLATGVYSESLVLLFNVVSNNLLAAGPGPGVTNSPLVRVFNTMDLSGHLAQWQAYGTSQFGVNVALGRLDGDILQEVVTGPGPGPMFGPHVRGFEPDGTPLSGISFLAYGTSKFGVNVACGDLDGDGFDEIVTGAGPGTVFGPHVRGWNWDGVGVAQSIVGISYFAYGTHRWGVNVSCGDIDGDGFDEIVTGAGPGAVFGPHVRGWDWDGSGSAEAIPEVSILAYSTNKFGVNVACGDIDGDGMDEIITGAGPGVVFGPHVRGWNWDGAGKCQPIPGISYFAYSYDRWGVNISCGDIDGDGIDELLTGPGPGSTYPAHVRGWNYDGQMLTASSEVDFVAYDSMAHGVKVAGSRH